MTTPCPDCGEPIRLDVWFWWLRHWCPEIRIGLRNLVFLIGLLFTPWRIPR